MSSIHVTNVKDASGNAALVTESGGVKTDKLTGITTAGSISVVGEGNSTTTNLQQGLLKCWHYGAADGSAAYDSFNLSSLGDTGTGHQTVNFANNFGNNNYSVTNAQGTGNNHTIKIDTRATSSQQIKIYDINSGAFEDSTQFSQFSGDLA